jgi:hypothetical protein
VKGPPPHVRLFNFVRNFVVGTSITTLLVVGTAAFLFLAMDIPGMLAAGIPDKNIPARMTHDFGFAQWPQLLRGIGHVVGWGALLLAAAVMIVARRNTYGLHILRGLVGVAVFAAGMLCFVTALRGTWEPVYVAGRADTLPVTGGSVVIDGHTRSLRLNVEADAAPAGFRQSSGPDADAERVATAVERYLETARLKGVPVAGLLSLLALVLICWPARRAREATFDADDAALPPAVGNV